MGGVEYRNILVKELSPGESIKTPPGLVFIYPLEGGFIYINDDKYPYAIYDDEEIESPTELRIRSDTAKIKVVCLY